MQQQTIKILLANDHSIMRTAIKNALHKTLHIQVIEEAVSFPDLFSKLQQSQPDILMSDDQMPGGYLLNDIPTIKQLYPDLKIIANTRHSDIAYLKKLIQLTDGLLSFSCGSEEYIKAVEEVQYGGIYFSVPGFRKTK
jgi:DNA-binding NarL/FixJ family response regulator